MLPKVIGPYPNEYTIPAIKALLPLAIENN